MALYQSGPTPRGTFAIDAQLLGTTQVCQYVRVNVRVSEMKHSIDDLTGCNIVQSQFKKMLFEMSGQQAGALFADHKIDCRQMERRYRQTGRTSLRCGQTGCTATDDRDDCRRAQSTAANKTDHHCASGDRVYCSTSQRIKLQLAAVRCGTLLADVHVQGVTELQPYRWECPIDRGINTEWLAQGPPYT